MTNEIKEILDRLERIDHKEYSGGFDFADSSDFEEAGRCFDERKKLAEYITNLLRQIKIMKSYFELIINIGFDYDGYNKAENLKSLIDELVRLASLGITANDTETMYMSLDDEEKHYNILNEEIKGEDNE